MRNQYLTNIEKLEQTKFLRKFLEWGIVGLCDPEDIKKANSLVKIGFLKNVEKFGDNFFTLTEQGRNVF